MINISKHLKTKARFRRRISVASNASQTMDNEIKVNIANTA